jgi:hypothetical protein
LALIAAFAIFVVWYLRACVVAAPTTENLLLILPVAGAAIVLIAIVAAGIVRESAQSVTATAKPWTRRTASVIVAFALYVIALPFAGFDVATFVFVAALLPALGERRPAVVGGLALAIAIGLTAGALATLSYPLPTLFVGRLWHLL